MTVGCQLIVGLGDGASDGAMVDVGLELGLLVGSSVGVIDFEGDSDG